MIRFHSSLKIPGVRWGTAGALFVALSLPLAAAEEWLIDLEYPSFQGDFYAVGHISFPPGAVRSEEQLRVQTVEGKQEIPTYIKVVRKWPDGSILKAEVLFPANGSRKTTHTLMMGDDVQRSKRFPQPAVLPTVSFSVSGAPKGAEVMDVDVGTMNIRVDRSPRIYYYWHLVPILLLTVLTWVRSRKTVAAP